MIYVLDTNVISDFSRKHTTVVAKLQQSIVGHHHVCITPPVHYEILRGLHYKNAQQQLTRFQQLIIPQLEWVPLENADWSQAAHFWARARRNGRQLSDVDLLLAAIAHRLNGIIVSHDADFDALPIQREDWRV